MSDVDPKDKLQELEARIAAVKKAGAQGKAHQEEHYSQANLAWRMVTEMVAGLGIGFGIGYALDMVLGTTPFLMVLFTLLGIAAGIKVMLRSAAEIQKQQIAQLGGDVEGATRKPGANEGDKNGD
ncbi:AtpZ/AtpI family protein [Tropicibacter oceani]|uniref:ATP synthase protein I n=1 Tax=Tropicibacter oceani TaxID=3058420 RepID=A0ABY8QJS1_9RHOB|nr:AtpZ/AtpI family protein [Tropicibacter oceani]WGW04251.1 AtpZ/AtpI family protein [Tropicibacter oceani]